MTGLGAAERRGLSLRGRVVQHGLPVAWHVVVVLGWTAALMIAPWASTWVDVGATDGFDGVYVTVLGL